MPEPLAPDRLVTVAEAGLMVGVSRRTIYNWIHAKKIRTVQIASGRHRIVASSLMDQVTASRAQHQALCQLANRIRATLTQRSRLMASDIVQLLEETVAALESLTT